MQTRSKTFIGFSTTLLVGTALAILGGSAPASAHAPEVSESCGGIAVELTSYAATPDEPTPNKLTVIIDDEQVAAERFGTSFTESFAFEDPTVSHEYTVAVDAEGTAYDRKFEGETEACPRAVPADATAAVSVTEPTCDEPGRLILGDVVNATWSTPTLAAGPGEYSVIATANEGHTFADGETTVSFTGVLLGALAPTNENCAVPVPTKPEPVVTSTSADAIDCTMAEVTTTTTTVSTGWNLDTATSTWVAAEPVTTVADAKRAATPVECPVAAAQPAQADDIEASPVAETLPETGSDAGWVVLIAGGLVLVGVQLMLMQRTRRVARENQS
ncbi:LPXTG cell wall anchor domain-containing protein [Mycetocola zhadangensis]|nr:LPXTG cell wall anchor domain-containing protein [Mycetocola zhadangensis]GGE92478.1 hypothetical protein GCM10011313_14300 [Mycetocola zhadangensis]